MHLINESAAVRFFFYLLWVSAKSCESSHSHRRLFFFRLLFSHAHAAFFISTFDSTELTNNQKSKLESVFYAFSRRSLLMLIQKKMSMTQLNLELSPSVRMKHSISMHQINMSKIYFLFYFVNHIFFPCRRETSINVNIRYNELDDNLLIFR